MTEEERFKITSNDYFDIFIEFNGNPRFLEQIPGITTQIIDGRTAVAYIPKEQITNESVERFGYSSFPSCYGLTSKSSLESSGVERIRRIPSFNLRGQGVLIAIIDTGIDYTNPVFLRDDGTSKIVSIWDQTIESQNYFNYAFYGTVYSNEQINQALASPNPLELVPSTDEIGHGTALAGIAAGREVTESNFSGVVPDADLVVVKLKQAKQNLREFYIIPDNVPCYQENDIMFSLIYVLSQAFTINRPVSIIIGLGTSQGNHSERSSLEDLFMQIADLPGVVASVSAGNEGRSRRHFFSTIDKKNGFTTVELNIGQEKGFTMELWGAFPNTYSIDILSPNGEYIPRIQEGIRVSKEISFIFEQTRIFVNYELVEEQTGDQLIVLRFVNPSSGIWRFKVYSIGTLEGSFHIWLPSDNFITENTYFLQPDPYTTITNPGNATVPITVTAYDSDNESLYQDASRGYTRYNYVKPDLAAPGVNLLCPTLNHTFSTVTGTSYATAHMAGLNAMILEWGIVRGTYPELDSVAVKKFLIRGARRSPTIQYPNRDWGYGIADINNSFNILRSNRQGS